MLGLATVLCAFLLASCTNLPFLKPGPGAAVKGMLGAALQGNVDEMLKYAPESEQQVAKATSGLFGEFGRALGQEFLKLMAAEMQRDLKSKGGVTAIDIDREQVEGDAATVDFTIRFGNGQTRSGQAKCVRENGSWKVTL
jgi:hypothetical protein